MKVWKIASRWSEDGNHGSSVLELFKNFKIAFVFNDNIRVAEVEIGHLLAISDGLKIVAIGKVLSKVTPVEDFHIPELDVYNEDECSVGFKIELLNLKESDILDYGRRGRFHQLHDKVQEKIIKYWEQRNKRFSINARTCTLKSNNQNGDSLLGGKTKYIVPIYQRPYSWTEGQVSKFISDIFISYWGNDGIVNEEPMFIGTMQLTERYFSSESRNEQEIIDGQQRISTFLVLLKVLSEKFPESKELNSISYDWIETRVNKGSQEIFLKEFIASRLEYIPETQNNYLRNSYLIRDIINEQLIDENGQNITFEIERFIKHILSNIYFVVIETYAGLSKTLQIFNAINTTGLDLNGSDIFKIRMYEYLKDIKGFEDLIFEKISGVYEKIDQLNSKFGKETDISGILSLYQHILIAKYEMPTVLHDYGQERFFDELFDTKFGIAQPLNFGKAKEVNLDLEEIERLIDVRYQWISGYYIDENIAPYHTAKDYCVSHQIGWSRYSRYWILRFLFAYKFPYDTEKISLFMELVSKYIVIYSLLFEKTVTHAHTTIRLLMREIFKEGATASSIIELISNEIQKEVPNKGNSRESIANVLKNDIVYSAKKKNLICRLSAMFDEEDIDSTNIESIVPLIKKLYLSSVDIEHIHSTEDSSIVFEKSVQNGIGNIVLLEYKLNRSLGKEPYSTKQIRYLSESSINSVMKIANENSKWSMDEAIKRRDIQIQKITDYFYGKLLFTELAAHGVPLDSSDVPKSC